MKGIQWGLFYNKYKDVVGRNAVNIMRPSKWGNPFVIGRDGNRADVINKYRAWIVQRPKLIAAARAELKGKDLVCCCSPLDCHGHVLIELINDEEDAFAEYDKYEAGYR